MSTLGRAIAKMQSATADLQDELTLCTAEQSIAVAAAIGRQRELINDLQRIVAMREQDARDRKAPMAAVGDMWAASLNRRAVIEQRMFDAAGGKTPLPTPEQLREWALYLGDGTRELRMLAKGGES